MVRTPSLPTQTAIFLCLFSPVWGDGLFCASVLDLRVDGCLWLYASVSGLHSKLMGVYAFAWQGGG